MAQKLYIEEQMRKTWNAAYTDALDMDEEEPKSFEDFIESLTPIELPNDEEIEKKADEYLENKWEYAQDECKETFTDCAKWLRDKILNQNK